MKKIGFSINKENTEIAVAKSYVPVVEEPKLCVATVRFEDGREYPYINDRFNLSVGDHVYVDGKLRGQIGEVINTTTKFKVSLKYYKYIMAKVDFSFHGSFEEAANFFVSRGKDVLPIEQLVTWLPPQEEEPEEFIKGEGYTLNVNDIESNDDFDWDEADAAVNLLTEDCVQFVSVINGEGHAVIKNKRTHTIDFKVDGNLLTDIYCDCISAKMCKHIIAIAVAIRTIFDKLEINENENFTAIDVNLFAKATKQTKTTITV